MIDRNHPAVKAMIGRRLNVGDASDMAADRLTAALPHLTADDLPAREENTRYREMRARMEALADQYDAEAEELYDFSGGMSDEAEWLEATATRIRAALNEDSA